MRLLCLSFALLVSGCPSSGAQPAPRPHPSPGPVEAVALPGGCVDPSTDARARFGKDAEGDDMRVERAQDLDRDGVLDPFVTHASFCGTGGCRWQLYVARKGCAHWVGELFGLAVVATASTSKGLADVEVAARNGCGGLDRTEVRARFDGREYLAYEMRRCHCPEGTPGGAPDPEALCDEWKPASKEQGK